MFVRTLALGVALVAAACSGSASTNDAGAGQDLLSTVSPDLAGGACPTRSGLFTVSSDCGGSGVPTHICYQASADCSMVALTPRLPFSGTVTGDSFSIKSVDDSCTGTIATDNSLVLSCGGCSLASSAATVANVTATCCDTVKQGCASGQRCTMVAFASGGRNLTVSGCIADDGTKGKGEECVRAGEAVTDAGRDNCKKGLFCTPWGAAKSTAPQCAPFCQSSAECGSGSVCSLFSGLPPAGLCVAACDPYGAQSGCGVGMGCFATAVIDMTSSFQRKVAPVCLKAGAGKEGDSCKSFLDCESSMTCDYSSGAGYCRRLCKPSDSMSCATLKKTCTPLSLWTAIDGATDFGFCQ